jgi:hypothetical protein
MIDLADCQVLGIIWDGGDHSVLHRGERPCGKVYPVTLEPEDGGGTLLRWMILPDERTTSPAVREPG